MTLYVSDPMLTREEVLNIAKLARLELSEDEVALYQKRLGRVLDYVRELSSLDTGHDAAFVKHVPKDAVAFRADKALPFAGHGALLENAPAAENHSFRIPAVMDGEE